MTINKVFFDGGAKVNRIPHSLFKNMGKNDEDLRPYNMVLSNYEGNTTHISGVIQVDLLVVSTSSPTLFMVITSNANYNLLLEREWICKIGAMPRTQHPTVAIWEEDGIVENIEFGQSFYKVEVGEVGRKYFDRNL